MVNFNQLNVGDQVNAVVTEQAVVCVDEERRSAECGSGRWRGAYTHRRQARRHRGRNV